MIAGPGNTLQALLWRTLQISTRQAALLSGLSWPGCCHESSPETSDSAQPQSFPSGPRAGTVDQQITASAENSAAVLF